MYTTNNESWLLQLMKQLVAFGGGRQKDVASLNELDSTL